MNESPPHPEVAGRRNTWTRRRLLCFGLGYSAYVLAERLTREEWTVSGTARSADHVAALTAAGYQAWRFDRDHPLPAAPPHPTISPTGGEGSPRTDGRQSGRSGGRGPAFAGVTHILVSVPPEEAGDPVLDRHGDDIAALLPDLEWLGYLSTTGIYGNRDGGWVDESAELRPTGTRGRRRVAVEQGWLNLQRRRGVPVHVFRLAGIYGPGRSPFDALRAGAAKRIERPGQVFSRIHVADLASVLCASIARPRPGAIYNVCDDMPAAPAEIVAYAADLLGLAPPPPVAFEAAELSPMARSFWDDNKRVSNALIKRELGVALRYPDYRAGLRAILAAGG